MQATVKFNKIVGGEFQLASEFGAGTTATIRLPPTQPAERIA